MLLNRAWSCYKVLCLFIFLYQRPLLEYFFILSRAHFSKLLTSKLNRILGEVTPERVEMVRQADHIFISMIREWNLYDKISQAFAALDTSKAVGVMVSNPSRCFYYAFNY